ncbi:DUF4834 domain-containing protein [Persicitalea jodogahamensis]|nr:DUF4834 domain-containing protein [Persicitalea jodogahamensis]
MKIVFNIFLILSLLIAFVPPFRRFLFHLLVGRQLMKEQRKYQNGGRPPQREGSIRVDPTAKKSDNDTRFRGGEYVDYEEVK